MRLQRIGDEFSAFRAVLLFLYEHRLHRISVFIDSLENEFIPLTGRFLDPGQIRH
jgi:hypothetical protein